MATSVQITSLKINVMTKDQYQAAKNQGKINSNEIYLVKN